VKETVKLTANKDSGEMKRKSGEIRWERVIKELFILKPDIRGALVEIAAYPFLRKIFGKLERCDIFDFRVKGKDIFIEIKIAPDHFKNKYYYYVQKAKHGSLYLVYLSERGNPSFPGSIEAVEDTPIGKLVLFKLDMEGVSLPPERSLQKSETPSPSVRKFFCPRCNRVFFVYTCHSQKRCPTCNTVCEAMKDA